MSSSKSARHLLRRASIVLAALALAACPEAQQKPARQAIAQVEAALADAGGDPARYAPGDLNDVERRLDSLKHHYASGEYDVVLQDAPAVLALARGLQDRAAARVRELAQDMESQWSSLVASVPASIESARRAVPGNGSDATARTQRLDDADALWKRAVGQHDAGHLAEAVTLGHQALELTQHLP